jgi:hypothetical protein
MHLARLEARTAQQPLLNRRLPALRLDPARPRAPRGLVFPNRPSCALDPSVCDAAIGVNEKHDGDDPAPSADVTPHRAV